VAYPPRPQLRPLAQFRGTAVGGKRPRTHDAEHQRLVDFVLEQYAAGRSLRQIAELTDRSFSAVRNILDRAGVHRRDIGAPRTTTAKRRRPRPS
jgi:hypothetical protein